MSLAIAQTAPQSQQVVDTRYTQDVIPVLDTSKFEHMQRIATVMAECNFIPQDLRKGDTPAARMATSFMIVNQAVRWGMDPFALAQNAYVLSNKLGYEGKAIAAAINSAPNLKGRLGYEFSGEGDARKVVVSGTFKDTGETKTVEGTVGRWKTKNAQWQSDPDQMLVYRGSRQWARRWMPDRLLGVYADDELEELQLRDVPTGQRAQRLKDVTPAKSAPLEIPDDIPALKQEQPDAKPEQDEPLADAAGFLEKLAEDIALCSSVEELKEVAENNADMIQRLPKAEREKAGRMLQEAAE